MLYMFASIQVWSNNDMLHIKIVVDGMFILTYIFYILARSAITAAPPTNHVPVIIGVIVVFIVLILVVAMLLFIWR